jgi:hypothetical protein
MLALLLHEEYLKLMGKFKETLQIERIECRANKPNRLELVAEGGKSGELDLYEISPLKDETRAAGNCPRLKTFDWEAELGCTECSSARLTVNGLMITATYLKFLQTHPE